MPPPPVFAPPQPPMFNAAGLPPLPSVPVVSHNMSILSITNCESLLNPSAVDALAAMKILTDIFQLDSLTDKTDVVAGLEITESDTDDKPDKPTDQLVIVDQITDLPPLPTIIDRDITFGTLKDLQTDFSEVNLADLILQTKVWVSQVWFSACFIYLFIFLLVLQ